jgi:hypothetical protein
MITEGSVVRLRGGKLTSNVVTVLYGIAILDSKLNDCAYWPLNLLVEVARPRSCPDANKKAGDIEA